MDVGTEKLVHTIEYEGINFEVVERPDVLWAGCVEYANNNTDEPDIFATLNRFRGLVEHTPVNDKINPDWWASISINYSTSDKTCGIMFANETYSSEQDEQYDLFTQPGGLWLRVRNDKNAAVALLGKENAEAWEYFAGEDAPLQKAARENGYLPSPDVHVQIEYYGHDTIYAYMPIIKL